MKNEISLEQVLQRISDAVIFGNLGLFIGSGFTKAALEDSYKYQALTWVELLKKVGGEMNVKEDSIFENHITLPEVASKICRLYAEAEDIDYDESIFILKNKVAQIMNWHPTLQSRQRYKDLFCKIEPAWIITTNYDSIIESILVEKGISYNSTDMLVTPKDYIPIYHLHGSRYNPDSIVITQEDYVGLFRPTEYRLNKLPVLLQESTTIFMGYNLGDINVLTAIDWCNNVFKLAEDQTLAHPHETVQLVYIKGVPQKPYRDEKNVIIVEIDNIDTFLRAVVENIEVNKSKRETAYKNFEDFRTAITTDSELLIKKIISEEAYQKRFFENFFWDELSLINEMIELLSKIFDDFKTSESAPYAFDAYAMHLKFLITIFTCIGNRKLHPIYFDFLSNELMKLSQYIGKNKGQSFAALDVWNNEKQMIDENLWKELVSYSKSNFWGKGLEQILVR